MNRVIVVTGLIAQYPFAGMSWHYVNYILGLKKLGYDVYYVEDAYKSLPFYFSRGSRFDGLRYVANLMESIGLKGKWTVLDTKGERHGLSRDDWRRVVPKAVAFINVSGINPIRGGLERIPVKIFIDTDPGKVQIGLANGNRRVTRHVRGHDIFFTYGETLRLEQQGIDSCGINWIPIRQPIFLVYWKDASRRRDRGFFTTVMNWKSYENVSHRGKRYGQKNIEFKKIWDLPKKVQQKFEVALAIGSKSDDRRTFRMLLEKGWRIVAATAPTFNTRNYSEYLMTSRGEFTVVKNLYARLNTGWTSERSACYLASGRPVLMQETGISDIMKTDRGLVTFSGIGEAAEQISRIDADYLDHCKCARKMAERLYDSDVVLKYLLGKAGLGTRSDTKVAAAGLPTS